MGGLRPSRVFINLFMADLVTLSDYKDAEGIVSPKEDLRISRIIPSVSELVKTYCANTFVDFVSSDKTEEFDIYWDTYAVQLTESPVISITSVQERSGYDQSYTTLTTGAVSYTHLTLPTICSV